MKYKLIQIMHMICILFIISCNFRKENIESKQDKEIWLQHNLKLNWENSGKQIPLNYRVVAENGDTLLLVDLLEPNTIIFKYSDLNCNSCVDSVFSIINKQRLNDRLIIISKYKDPRYLSIFKRIHKYTMPIYNEIGQLPFTIDALNIPYFFYYQDKNYCTHFFYTIKDNIMLKYYLDHFNKKP